MIPVGMPGEVLPTRFSVAEVDQELARWQRSWAVLLQERGPLLRCPPSCDPVTWPKWIHFHRKMIEELTRMRAEAASRRSVLARAIGGL